MWKQRIRTTAVLLAGLMLLLTPARAADGNILPQREHLDMPLEELEQQTFTLEEFRQTAEQVTDLCTREENLQQTEEALWQLRRLYLGLDTALNLASVHSDQDVTDETASETYLTRLTESYDVDEIMADTVLTVLDSPCWEAVDQEDMVFSLFLWEYEPLTEEEEDLYLEEQALIDRYFSSCQQTWTVELDGRSYTEDEAYEAYLQGDISWEAYDDAATRVAMQQNDALAEIYVELVENRVKQAALYGYDDYAALQDDTVYYRDYTRGEISVFSGAVKREIVPLRPELEAQISAYADAGAYGKSFTETELLTCLRTGIADISEEMLPALDYMTEYGYYDIGPSETKVQGAYTTILTYPNAPFLLMRPEGSSVDFTTLVHEFGHYNGYFCSDNVYMANYDLSELHSQGLELLMTAKYDSVFGEDAQAERVMTLYEILTAMVDGCMMDELERYAYSEPDLTVEKLNRKYMQLLKDYGYREQNDPAEEAYGWVMTSHLYGYPLYYVSYGVSAAGALEIWEQSLTDWDGAVETYLRLVGLGESGYFLPGLREVGLDNPLTEKSVQKLAGLISQQLLSSPAMAEQTAPVESGGQRSYGAGIAVIACVLVAADVLIVTVILVLRRKEKRR